MKKTAAVALLVIAVLLVSATSGFAWVRGGGGGGGGGWNGGGWHGGGWNGRGVVVVRPGCCWGPYWGWGWGWGGYGGYYPPPYYYPAPQVVVQPAPIYSDTPAAPEESYWYYCASTKAYYPNVPSCNEAWIKVPPRSE